MDIASDPVADRLAEQRKILVSGPLDLAAVTGLAARLMTFDGLSSRPVDVLVNSGGGPVAEIFAALDVISLMRAPVNTTCIGAASGTAVALVAAASGRRTAAPHARFTLRCEERHTLDATMGDLVRQADELVSLTARYVSALAEATGQDEQLVAEEVDRGAQHNVERALELGVIDAVVGDDEQAVSKGCGDR